MRSLTRFVFLQLHLLNRLISKQMLLDIFFYARLLQYYWTQIVKIVGFDRLKNKFLVLEIRELLQIFPYWPQMKSDTLLIPYASLFFHSFESNLFRQFAPSQSRPLAKSQSRPLAPSQSLQVSTSPSLHIAKSPRHQVALSPSRRSPTRQVAHSLPRKVSKSPNPMAPPLQSHRPKKFCLFIQKKSYRIFSIFSFDSVTLKTAPNAGRLRVTVVLSFIKTTAFRFRSVPLWMVTSSPLA